MFCEIRYFTCLPDGKLSSSGVIGPGVADALPALIVERVPERVMFEIPYVVTLWETSGGISYRIIVKRADRNSLSPLYRENKRINSRRESNRLSLILHFPPLFRQSPSYETWKPHNKPFLIRRSLNPSQIML